MALRSIIDWLVDCDIFIILSYSCTEVTALVTFAIITITREGVIHAIK